MSDKGSYFKNALKTSPKRSTNLTKRVLISLLLGLLSVVGISFLNQVNSAKELISPVGQMNQISFKLKNTPILGALIEANFNFNDEQLSKIVTSRLAGQNGDFAIVVEGLNPGSQKRLFYNDHKIMPTASLYKLFLIAAAYRAIENGELTEDTILTVPESHLIDVLGSKEYGYEDTDNSNITYSVRDILSRIATVSDNYAAVMLAEKLGWDKVQAEAGAIGAEDTTIKDPISTTASDIALFWQKLYDKQIVSVGVSDQIMDLLSTTRINDRIPDQLPQGLKIAHKTGELSKIRHDAGIVYLEGNPYLIVMMSENLEYEDDGTKLLSDISKDVYDYFMQSMVSAEPR